MKQRMLCLLLAVLLLSLCAAAESIEDETVEIHNQWILDNFNKVQSKSYVYAKEDYEAIVAYYEKTPQRKAALDNYPNAGQMYYYAKGRVYLYDNQYAEACNAFELAGTTGILVAQFRNYANGMFYMQIEQYAEALKYLNALQEVPDDERWGLTAAVLIARRTCIEQYTAQLILEGDRACAVGNHEQAQQYYLAAYQQLKSSEAKVRYDACIAHSSSYESPRSIEILFSETIDNGDLLIAWEGSSNAYDVYMSMDLSANAQDESVSPIQVEGTAETLLTWTGDDTTRAHCWEVEWQDADGVAGERIIAVRGLLPGVVYRLEIHDRNADNTYQVVGVGKDSAPLFANDTRVSCIMYRYDKRTYTAVAATMNDSDSLFPYLYQNNKVTYMQDNILDLRTSGLRTQGVYLNLIMSNDEGRDALENCPYTMMLYCSDLGTIQQSGVFFQSKAAKYGGNCISVLLDELFSMAEKRYGSIQGKAYRLTILTDNQTLLETMGTVQ